MDEQDWLAARFNEHRGHLIAVAPRGRLYLVLRPVVRGQRIASIEVVADPDSLRQLEIAVPED